MDAARALELVDRRQFRELFVDLLGWSNPDQQPLTVEAEGSRFTLSQVAGYKGLRVWYCDALPSRKVQRLIDQAVGAQSHERLVIFSDDHNQAWRWPRRARLGAANAKLVLHGHRVGSGDQRLVRQLAAVAIDFDQPITLVDLLARMRAAFDFEAEAASTQAARLMGTLYAELERARWDQHNATLLLARLLFLLFADDSGMWRHDQRSEQFQEFIREHTTTESLADDLDQLFAALNTEEEHRSADARAVIRDFRYVNGGLFTGDLMMGTLTTAFRDALLEAAEFDWSTISPAVFGSMFQTVKTRAERRSGGEHYTTETNILRTIDPLFMDGLRERFERAKDNQGELTKLHNHLGEIRVLDPACGCGNFLIIAYRELRALELEILLRKRELAADNKGQIHAQLTFDVTADLKVTLDHFYGIEIEEWPARIAETAMLLVDHLANQRMAEDFGFAPDRLPIRIAPTIVRDNALTTSWETVVSPSSELYVLGNPPWVGHKERTAEQGDELRLVWGTDRIGHRDYVTGWFAKVIGLFREAGYKGKFAFVSTNSIAQGESVASLFDAIFADDWRIAFAHRNFAWSSEAPGEAAAHCVIVGFDKNLSPGARLFEYPNPKGLPVEVQVLEQINGYLIDGPLITVPPRAASLARDLPELRAGSTPIDWDGFLVPVEAANTKVPHPDMDAVHGDAIASKYLRRYMGGEELIHNRDRWCLWLQGVSPSEVANSPVLRDRVEWVRRKRAESSRAATNRLAQSPHLFGEIRQPTGRYLAIPQTFSEDREFIPAGFLDSDVIASIKLFAVELDSDFAFGIVESSAFLTWQATVGGRLESRHSLSQSITWNTFPLPALSSKQRAAIIAGGEAVLEARAKHPDRSLAKHYVSGAISPELLAAHAELDQSVDGVFGLSPQPGESARLAALFSSYQRLAAADQLDLSDGRRRRR